ncbi:MAG TPA: acyltransferase [Opitutaceae bacterium]|nr:acyltransferase [Opitutaceae bacterium]
MHLIPATYFLLASIYGGAWGIARLLVRNVGPVRAQLATHGARRQVTLDGLRGVLALAVMCCHAMLTYEWIQHGTWGGPTMLIPEGLGETAVMLFFMITAFLFWDRMLDRGATMDWRGFFVGRIFRLCPLYFLAVAGIVGLALLHQRGHLVVPAGEFRRQVAAWLAFTVRGSPNINGLRETAVVVAGAIWSLPYEWLFYFSLPVLGFVLTRARSSAAMIAGLVLMWGFFRLKAHHSVDRIALLPFASGILAAYWTRIPVLATAAKSKAFGLVALAALATALVTCRTPYTVLPAVLATPFFLAAVCDSPLLRGVRGAEARWLGEVSYGIYLFHGMAIWIATRLILPRLTDVHALGPTAHLVMDVAIAALLLPIVSVFHFAVEKPGIEVGQKLARHFTRRRGATAVAGGPLPALPNPADPGQASERSLRGGAAPADQCARAVPAISRRQSDSSSGSDGTSR